MRTQNLPIEPSLELRNFHKGKFSNFFNVSFTTDIFLIFELYRMNRDYKPARKFYPIFAHIALLFTTWEKLIKKPQNLRFITYMLYRFNKNSRRIFPM